MMDPTGAVKVAPKAGGAEVICKATATSGARVTVTCPIDSGLADGTDVVWK